MRHPRSCLSHRRVTVRSERRKNGEVDMPIVGLIARKYMAYQPLSTSRKALFTQQTKMPSFTITVLDRISVERPFMEIPLSKSLQDISKECNIIKESWTKQSSPELTKFTNSHIFFSKRRNRSANIFFWTRIRTRIRKRTRKIQGQEQIQVVKLDQF